MKRTSAALMLFVLLCLLAGCRSTASLDGAEVTSEAKPDASAFAALGVKIALPDGATDAQYAVLDGDVAQATFSVGEARYTYQASAKRALESPAGDAPNQLEATIRDQSDEGTPLDILVRRAEDGRCTACWHAGGAWYRLDTDGNPLDFDAVALRLSKTTRSD